MLGCQGNGTADAQSPAPLLGCSVNPLHLCQPAAHSGASLPAFLWRNCAGVPTTSVTTMSVDAYSPEPSPGPSPGPAPPPDNGGSSGTSMGVIIGAVAGGVAVIAVSAVLFVLFKRKRRVPSTPKRLAAMEQGRPLWGGAGKDGAGGVDVAARSGGWGGGTGLGPASGSHSLPGCLWSTGDTDSASAWGAISAGWQPAVCEHMRCSRAALWDPLHCLHPAAVAFWYWLWLTKRPALPPPHLQVARTLSPASCCCLTPRTSHKARQPTCCPSCRKTRPMQSRSRSRMAAARRRLGTRPRATPWPPPPPPPCCSSRRSRWAPTLQAA